jgi:N-acetylglucosamine-6-sulfatase
VPVVTEGLIKNVHRRRAGSDVPDGLTTSGLRTGRYKLIRYANGDAELYDLMTDPNELASVWDDPSYAAVRRQLVNLWEQYKTCRGDGCQVALPGSLQTTPEWLDGQYRNARAEQRSYYGR